MVRRSRFLRGAAPVFDGGFHGWPACTGGPAFELTAVALLRRGDARTAATTATEADPRQSHAAPTRGGPRRLSEAASPQNREAAHSSNHRHKSQPPTQRHSPHPRQPTPPERGGPTPEQGGGPQQQPPQPKPTPDKATQPTRREATSPKRHGATPEQKGRVRLSRRNRRRVGRAALGEAGLPRFSGGATPLAHGRQPPGFCRRANLPTVQSAPRQQPLTPKALPNNLPKAKRTRSNGPR